MAIERIVPGTIEWDAYYANHIIRYQFAAEQIKKRAAGNILDAACGVGYGSNFLSKQFPAATIAAIDRSLDALGIARKLFSGNKINFLEDDCHTLKAAGQFAPFDTIVSFETLEHLPKPADFLSACFKNLTPGGCIIVSTPNQLVSSPDELNWEYHEKEYTAAELFSILQAAGFKNIQLYGQQFNIKGKIKNEVRADLNSLFSNPFIRFGRFLQRTFKGRTFGPVLKETEDDFEVITFGDANECDEKGLQGPFVLIAVAEK